MEASADPRKTTHPAIPTDTALYSELRACTDSSTAYSALPYHPTPGLGVYDPSQLHDGQWPQDGCIQQQHNEPNAFISSFNPVSDMASFFPQETHSSMHVEFPFLQDAPSSAEPCYPAMGYRDSADPDIVPSSELHGSPNPFIPSLDFFDINGHCDEDLFHAGPISEHHSVLDDFNQSFDLAPDLAPLFNPQEPHPGPSTYEEFTARQDASTTFGNSDFVSPGRQTTSSLATQSVYNWHPEPLHDGTISQKPAHDAEYERDLRRSKDHRYLKVLQIITGTMAKVEIPMNELVPPETRERIDQGIGSLVQYLKGELLLSSTDAELQSWLQRVLDKFSKCNPVGTHAQIGKALERREYQRDRLYICFWCENTLTTPNGLGNHLRTHLEFPMSFCHHPGCNFSSVAPTLPKRHLDIKHGLKLKLVHRRGKTHVNGTSS
ncbi:hypothetical protein BJ165DRAFT_1534940 [Panaeolus papilionaceus]|nr:hypothetical protein BJ165DRAFT_1534940 [Panaeolus papilionaceus]